MGSQLSDALSTSKRTGSNTTSDDQAILEDVFENIKDCLHGPIPRFTEKYFGSFQYIHRDDSLKIQAPGGRAISCSSIDPAATAVQSPDDFRQWLCDYLQQERDGARGSWDVFATSKSDNTDEDASGTRLLLTLDGSYSTATPHGQSQTIWDHVQVVGQLYPLGAVSYREGLVQLSRWADEVFARQPLRLFIHGFYIRGPLVEFFVFDRSGLYCSEVLNFQKDFIRFLSLILSYQLMTDRELGVNHTIETDDEEGGNYIMLDNDNVTGKLYFDSSQPIASRNGIVGSGTSCYRAKLPGSDHFDCALKVKWRWARDRPEDKLLRVAQEKGAWGAVTVNYYQEVETTSSLRSGLRWGRHRKFDETDIDTSQVVTKEEDDHGLADYTQETRDYFRNLILTYTVTSPLGRPLHTFRSARELLEVFRDAIKCHRSLYQDAQILHQDVSAGNIIILDEENENDRENGAPVPKGILIDLDTALDLTEDRDPERGITGTRPFMAIGTLKREFRTYRHDLEAFFYVFLWTVITNRSPNPPDGSRLLQWSTGDWEELARRKAIDMEPDSFGLITAEFPREFENLKPLAESLHHLLFPLRDGKIWTGTDDSAEATNALYNGMINAFEETIDSTL